MQLNSDAQKPTTMQRLTDYDDTVTAAAAASAVAAAPEFEATAAAADADAPPLLRPPLLNMAELMTRSNKTIAKALFATEAVIGP